MKNKNYELKKVLKKDVGTFAGREHMKANTSTFSQSGGNEDKDCFSFDISHHYSSWLFNGQFEYSDKLKNNEATHIYMIDEDKFYQIIRKNA